MEDKKTHCTHLAGCPMFSVFESKASGAIFRKIYCEGDFTKCVRYQRSEAGQSVSPLLLPNGTSLHP